MEEYEASDVELDHNHENFESELEFVADKVLDFKRKFELMTDPEAEEVEDLIELNEIEILVGIVEFLIEKSLGISEKLQESNEERQEYKEELTKIID